MIPENVFDCRGMSVTVPAQAWGERLRAAGLRVTQPRVAVLHCGAEPNPHIVG